MKIALFAGLIALAVALGVLLSHAPLTVAGSNNVPANFAVTYTHGGEVVCQSGGTLPARTTAIRVSLSPNVGPTVRLKVFSGSTLLTEGAHQAGWGVDESLTVPVKRVARTTGATRICTTIGPAVEGVQVNGIKSSSGPGRYLLRMEYLRPGPSSWLSIASSVAHRVGVGHSPSGNWVAYALIILMLGVCILTSRLVLKEVR